MLHGYFANRLQVLALAGRLAAQGYECLLMELRGHGARPGPCTFGVKEVRDLGAVLAWAQTHGALPVGIVGFSLGGLCHWVRKSERRRSHWAATALRRPPPGDKRALRK